MKFQQNIARRSRPFLSSDTGGLGEWLLRRVRAIRCEHPSTNRQMRLLETLPLGGKRQLLLVSCGSERFLIGGGGEGVEAIVRLKGEASLDPTAEKLDIACL